RVAADAEAQMALLELLVPHQNLRHHLWRFVATRLARFRQRPELLLDEVANPIVLEIPDRGDDQILGGVDATEIVAQQVGVERFDGFLGPEDWPAERMVLPEPLGE